MSDDRTVNKTLISAGELTGVLRDESSMINPQIRVENDGTPIRANYCYIPDFQRYYFINEVIAYRHKVWDLSLSVDVLMSFRGDIAELYVIVDKAEDENIKDMYIDDGSLVMDNVMYTQIINFPNGFNQYPELVLITAG